ncbi:fluoride efflux transporter CrcB [Deefgea sp. CFH1-16]|uniref:fluoride efflux transporter CrcB n=1 Tax=Deefgea sp. CFH1-16 TaxID=2675457 RepID=UPI0015F3B0BC|nr:fluoride efflux transporter CrcB [Deefgea sp. CFH1-16]MBM5573186.1 fluoride efflux transporter CrcB [Deefgea sp. CFH1-16]
MANWIILIFVGGAFGAMCREFIMLLIPPVAGGFPLDIFIANMLASFLLGLSTSFHRRVMIHHHVHTMVGTGIMGGMSTFSSYIYGSLTMLKTPGEWLMACAYLLLSVVLGFAMVMLGLYLAQKTQANSAI